jgi:glycyl-tRNA synthetase
MATTDNAAVLPTAAAEEDLDALNAKITKQGSLVRQLKKDGASPEVIAQAVELLQQLKIRQTELAATQESQDEFNRKNFDDLILRKMFVVPSFEIHGGVKGLFDLGPPACALKVSVFDFMIYLRLIILKCSFCNLTITLYFL